MAEPRDDMLPEKSQTSGPSTEDVKEPEESQKEEPQASPPPHQEDEVEEQAPSKEPEKRDDAPPKGHVPLNALQEERKRRKEAEQRVNELESSSAPSQTVEEYEDESSNQDPELREEVRRLREERELDRLLDREQFKPLNDHLAEFDEFREEHSQMGVEEAAKLFLFDQGLIGQERKGVESPTKGPKEPPKADYTFDEMESLRKNQPRKYEKLLRDGAFDEVA